MWQQAARNHDAIGGALHSAFSGLSDVDAGRPFAGVAFSKMRRPGAQRTFQHAGVENVSWLFHTLREPRQSTRLGPPYDRSCSRSKDGTCLMRLPSAMGGVRPLLLLRPFVKLTRMSGAGRVWPRLSVEPLLRLLVGLLRCAKPLFPC
jgi:hypothetical protein